MAIPATFDLFPRDRFPPCEEYFIVSLGLPPQTLDNRWAVYPLDHRSTRFGHRSTRFDHRSTPFDHRSTPFDHRSTRLATAVHCGGPELTTWTTQADNPASAAAAESASWSDSRTSSVRDYDVRRIILARDRLQNCKLETDGLRIALLKTVAMPIHSVTIPGRSSPQACFIEPTP